MSSEVDAPMSPSADQLDPAPRYIYGTPCFTEHITATPMPKEDRDVYISDAVDAAMDFLRQFDDKRSGHVTGTSETILSNVCALTLLLPELNPDLDVYDRRFLLNLTWALISRVAFQEGRKCRVLVQGAGIYGAVPLSIAGLRRTFEADLELSTEGWGGRDAVESVLRVGEIENPASVENDDDVFVVISPTNATGMPVIGDLISMMSRVGSSRPVICINPRLTDIPSSSGVMGTIGREDRIQFTQSMQNPFYFRLLYDAGTMYPLRGILYHRHEGPWQVWRHSYNNGNESYDKIAEFTFKPSAPQITDAFTADAYKRQISSDSAGSLDSVLVNNISVTLGVSAVVVALFAYHALSRSSSTVFR